MYLTLFGRKIALPLWVNRLIQSPEPAKEQFVAGVDSTPIPVIGGQSSLPEWNLSGIAAASNIALPLPYDPQLLRLLKHMSAHDPNVSYAASNSVLGNTNYNIYFDDRVSEEDQARMKAHLRQVSGDWYGHSEGLTSMISDLLRQLYIFGCISAEVVPQMNLRGVQRVVKVDPTFVRFVWTPEKGYQPVQEGASTAGNLGRLGGYRKLNPETYQYIALTRWDQTPYAVPPLLSAIEPALLHKNMTEGMSHIIQKMGLLGFLLVKGRAPMMHNNELPEQYQERVKKYLAGLEDQARKIVQTKNPFAAGLIDQVEFELNAIGADKATGAEKLVDINLQNLITSLKQSPIMLGRQFSTTEAFAKVVITKETGTIQAAQKCLAAFLERLFMLELLMAGYNPISIDVEFELPEIGDGLREQQVEQLKIANTIALRDQGIISQTQAAQALGYEQAAADGPILPELPDLDAGMFASNGETIAEAEQNALMTLQYESLAKYLAGFTVNADGLKEEIKAFEDALSQGYPEYQYKLKGQCGCSCAKRDKEGFAVSSVLERFIQQYLGRVRKLYGQAATDGAAAVARALGEIPENTPEDVAVSIAVLALYRRWGQTFVDQLMPLINTYTSSVYRYYRSFKEPLLGAGAAVPNATFGLNDMRALNFFRQIDQLYLGRFITDTDTRRRITNWLKEEYLAGTMPIGRGSEGIAVFKAKFETRLNDEDWKIRRVIDTSVNRMRNTGSIMYMEQAQIKAYQIQGVPDDLQCDWCRAVQGKTFTVQAAVQRQLQIFGAPPDALPNLSPFLTSAAPASDISQKTGTELQAMGFDMPPFHPHCRDTIIAVS